MAGRLESSGLRDGLGWLSYLNIRGIFKEYGYRAERKKEKGLTAGLPATMYRIPGG